MPAQPDTSVELRTLARYESLVRVSEALRAYHDRETLFRSLARELRPVVAFSFLGLALFDEQTHAVAPYVLEASGEPATPPELSSDEQLTYWVLRHQQPLIIPVVEDETRFAQEMAYLRSQRIRSTCSLPLTTPRRRVGMLIVGSREPHTYDAEEVTFLSLVANQVALAIDDTLNYGALQQTLALERRRADNLAASDELLRALSIVLDVREVFPRVSAIARKVLPHDRMTMAFHDREGEAVIQAASDQSLAPDDRVIFGTGYPAGPNSFVILDDLQQETFAVVQPADFWDRARAAGFRSLMIVRRQARDQQFGLGFWSRRLRAFDRRDVPIAQRIADHMALAISHEQLAEAARQIAEAEARAERLEARVRSLTRELDTRTGRQRVVGPSEEWKAVLKAATQVASTDTTVLLTGESGTGKEVVARFIHRASARRAGPFVALNCAALPEHLLEAELFGFERGAFTGAQQAKPGQIELAAAGVLFLDEVSEMSPSAQAKFLRVLQEREFQRLGGTRVLKANVRVIAATNRDLKSAMAQGAFREDLFYRLRVFDIRLPPLRERRGDILPLSAAFLHEIGQLFGRKPAGLAQDAQDALLRHQWPGNVRELRNALERAAILCEGSRITAEHLSLDAVEPDRQPPPDEAHQTTDLSVVERQTIARVLRECHGNKSKAARQLGLSRTQLYVRLRKYRLV
jgi:formate hydrogenlyase transcriptional activator